jgi:NifU-like protein involved in Fe-S cluster formation
MYGIYNDSVKMRGKHSRFRGSIADMPYSRNGNNSLCGDYVAIGRDPRTGELRFEASACLLCVASADLLCDLLRRVSTPEARAGLHGFLRALESQTLDGPFDLFSEVYRLPIRLACVRLPWDVALPLFE